MGAVLPLVFLFGAMTGMAIAMKERPRSYSLKTSLLFHKIWHRPPPDWQTQCTLSAQESSQNWKVLNHSLKYLEPTFIQSPTAGILKKDCFPSQYLKESLRQFH